MEVESKDEKQKALGVVNKSPLIKSVESSVSKIFYINYFLVALNLILCIWFFTMSRPCSNDFQSEDHELNTNLTATNSSFLSYWQQTRLELAPHCSQMTNTENIYNFTYDYNLFSECQLNKFQGYWQSPNEFFNYLPINILPDSNKKVISISFSGSTAIDIFTIIQQYSELLPGWIPRFWLGSDVPFVMINRLIIENAEVVIVHQKQINRSPGFNMMFWRFFVSDDENVERYIVRAVDCIPIKREVDAVNEWLDDGTTFHVMREIISSVSASITGGMWGGMVDKSIFSASSFYENATSVKYEEQDYYGAEFLSTFLWPIAKNRMTCHDVNYIANNVNDNTECKDFPSENDGLVVCN